MKKLLLFTILFSALLATQSAFSQETPKPAFSVDISSSPQPVGSGARALGMGGAFIAIADDATAASWNPAGLVILARPELSLVGSFANRKEKLEFQKNTLSSGDYDNYSYDFNYFSAALPFKVLNTYMVVSLNYQHLLDFGRKVDYKFMYESGDGNVSAGVNQQFRQSGSMRAIALAYALQISPTLALGLTANIWTDKLGYQNGWKQTSKVAANVVAGGISSLESWSMEEEFKLNGFNFNIGGLWDITANLTIGLVLKTPVWAWMKHTVKIYQKKTVPDFPEANSSDQYEGEYKERLTLPLQYGLGLSYRFSDALTVGVDAYRIEWSMFLRTDETGDKVNAINGKSSSDANIGGVIQARAGAEYLFILKKTVIPLRGGFFYDPEPAEAGPDNFFGFSVGTGASIIDSIIIDVVYQGRFGFRSNSAAVRGEKTDIRIIENNLLLSLIYHI